MKNIVVKDKIINITGINDEDYVSLTDIARIKNTDFPSDVLITNLFKDKIYNLFKSYIANKKVLNQIICVD